MKVYYNAMFKSSGFGGVERIAQYLEKYKPTIFEEVETTEEADLVVFHVVGRHDHVLADTRKIVEQGKQYAIIQYVLQSCRNPNPEDWKEIWDNAKVVWSYYNLEQYVPNMYHAPLGADSKVFKPVTVEKKYVVGAISRDYVRECVGELRLAAWHAHGRVAHVGNMPVADPNVDYFNNITDKELQEVYGSCKWWSCLRRMDGFEMPAIEALLCGTRPIMFDTPNYRQWFDGLVEFIPEDIPQKVVDSLIPLLRSEPNPITKKELLEVKHKFSWKSIITGFWNRCE